MNPTISYPGCLRSLVPLDCPEDLASESSDVFLDVHILLGFFELTLVEHHLDLGVSTDESDDDGVALTSLSLDPVGCDDVRVFDCSPNALSKTLHDVHTVLLLFLRNANHPYVIFSTVLFESINLETVCLDGGRSALRAGVLP